MLKNYLKIAFRSIWRAKVHSTINVLGLGLGIGCCILIVLFVRDEWTFDRFHSNASRIYRVWGKEDWGVNQQFLYTSTPFPMGPTLKDNFPEVEYQVRISQIGPQVKVGENLFSESVTIAGQDFFEVFDFRSTAGDPRNALRSQSGLVLSNRIAHKYFGLTDPINKVISISLGEKFEEFLVKAVVADPPVNSSIQFGILISDLNYPKLYSHQTLTSAWFNINPETYIMLRDGVDPKQVVSKFPSVFRTILGDEDFVKSKYAPGLQPLTSIHLDTSLPAGLAPVSNPKYSYILSAIALLILFVACINFVTLSVGRSIKRAKEVGVRKVVGAQRKQIVYQFIGEAVIVTVLALIAGILLAVINIPLFNDLSGKNLTLRLDGFTTLVALTLVFIIGLIAGSYPAFVLSGFKPISILKGSGLPSAKTGKQGLRRGLVGVQLVLSIFLVSSTLVMRDQLRYLQNKDLGFDKEQLAVIQLNGPPVGRLRDRIPATFQKAEQFKSELSRIADVTAVCASSHDFGNGGWMNIGYTDDNGTYRTFNYNTIDDDYLPTLKMELVAGRNFSNSNPSDIRRAIIVNEAFAREYGWKEAIGKKIPGRNFQDHEVIGVVKDFNYTSLYTKVEPLVMGMDPMIAFSGIENINTDNSPVPKLMVRLRPGNMAMTIDRIKGVWDKITGGEEFTFAFVDQTLDKQYRNDQNLSKIVSIATLLAMVIGSLGLYALASLAMQNRTREITIRKVMGATEQSLLLLLSKDYVYLIAISLLLSVPITWYLMTQWLQSFEFRISIGWEVFLWAGGLSLVVAIFTISYQAIKTASAQPAETLKYE